MLNLNSNVFITLYWTFFHFSTGRGENVTQRREQETESQNPETTVWKEQGFVILFVALCCLTYCEIGKSKLSFIRGEKLVKMNFLWSAHKTCSHVPTQPRLCSLHELCGEISRAGTQPSFSRTALGKLFLSFFLSRIKHHISENSYTTTVL